MLTILVGYYTEKATRELIEHTSYAADWVRHMTKPGRYPVYLTFEEGFTIPMPYWLTYGIDTDIVDGCTYSGYGGVIIGSTPVKRGPSKYTLQQYSYQAPTLLQHGLELLPGMEWVGLPDQIAYVKEHYPTWGDVRKLNKTDRG